MSYKFKKVSYSAPNIEPLWQYGVEVSDKTISALEQIESWVWDSEEVQNILDEINSITNEDFRYSVEGGALLMLVDKEEAHLFNLRNKSQKEADLIWSTEKFIKFLKEFQEFLQKNGR
ncbi:hypothetical protein QFZ37_000395 [Chryseobacterium ginsenosidimutans]|uniref:hypothetical protein n=1 Tax=Chryseobacterium ginsenosidimutans TaxID=687846 RepID=UPI0027888B26|nr:hypothetical protein [Chryseobacterium ginsenosidimutans]MDQ0592026.1 hypothetical protein [Chryseobacterium ginsenosidimutans]